MDEEFEVVGALPDTTLPQEEFEVIGTLPTQPPQEEEFEVVGALPMQSTLPKVTVDQSKPESVWYNPTTWRYTTEVLRGEEVDEIAKRHGVDRKKLDEAIDFLGGKRAGGAESVVEEAAGFISSSVGMGIPQWVYIKSQDDKTEAALADLRSLIEEKQGALGVAAEMGAGLATGIAGAVGKALLKGGAKAIAKETAAKTLATSTAMGGASGYFSTNQEEEGFDRAAVGAAFGLGLGGAAVGAGALGKKAATKMLGETTQIDELAESKAAQVFNDQRKIVDQQKKTSEELLFSGEGGRLNLDAIDKIDEIAIKIPNAEAESLAYRRTLSPEANEVLSDEIKLLKLPPEKQPAYILARKAELDAIELAEAIADEPVSSISKAKKILTEAEAVEGSAYLRQTMETIKDRRASEKLIAEGLTLATGKGKVNQFIALSDKIKDARFALAGVDRRLGTSAASTLDSLSASHNKMTRKLAEEAKDLADLSKSTKFVGLAAEEISRFLRTPKLIETLPEEQKTVVQAWRNWFERGRQDANAMYKQEVIKPFMKDGEVAYVPNMTKDREDVVRSLRQTISQVEQRYNIKLSEPIASDVKVKLLADKQYQELQQSVKYLNRLKPDAKIEITPELIQSTYQKLRGRNNLALDTIENIEASAAHKRSWEEVPPLIREDNIAKLAVKWTMNTNRHLFYRDTVRQLKTLEQLARAQGDKRAERYISNLLVDTLSPSSRNTIGTGLQQVTALVHATLDEMAERHPSRLTRGLASLLSENDSILRMFHGMIYPNFLGGSLRAAINNITQPLVLTVPELGYKYGSAQYLRSLLSTIFQPKKSITEMGILKREGFIPEVFSNDIQRALRYSIDTNKTRAITEDVLQAYSNGMMILFDRSEKINRLVVSKMANNIANDIMTNNSMARDFVRRLEPGVRQKLLQAKTANNAEAVAQITREYLIGKTLFNYNKFSSAEIARELGNVLSPFLKWPTAIYGDIAENYERYGVKQGSLEFTKKYLAPFFGLLTLHQLMLAAAGEDEETKNQLAGIFGKAGLPGSAPIGSLGALVSGDLLQPPVIQIPFDIITSVANMDPEKALKALSKTADAFLPGAGLIRMIGTDIPRLMGEEESGNTTFERLGLMDEYREAVE